MSGATAEGDLGKNPFAHLLVYAQDHRLNGTLFLRAPGGEEHAIWLVDGAPAKVRSGDGYLLLGEMLVERGIVTAKTLEDALTTGGLLGDVLVLAAGIDRHALEACAQEQFERRIVRLFSLPAETTYRYADGDETLCEYGGEVASSDPLALLWAGLREHGNASALFESVVARIAGETLRVHPAAQLERIAATADEQLLLDHLSAGPCSLDELASFELVAPEVVSRLGYLLVIARMIELGSTSPPVGVSAVPPSQQALAKLKLRATAHRLGAAAPDPAGDGGADRCSS